MLIRCEPKPQSGLTLVLRSVEATRGRAASHSYGWLNGGNIKHAFRYATANDIAYLKARYPLTCTLPAIGMAGYQCLMPTASLAKLQLMSPL